jgi:hypothetical protein
VEIVSCLTEEPELLRITREIFFRIAKDPIKMFAESL